MNKMRRVCCVIDCKAESLPGRRLSFHRFPTNELMYMKWLEAVPGKIRSSSVVCAMHFKPEDFSTHSVSLTQHLKPNAVPSIFKSVIRGPSHETSKAVSRKAKRSKNLNVMDEGHETDYDSGDTDYERYNNKNDGDGDNTDFDDRGDSLNTEMDRQYADTNSKTMNLVTSIEIPQFVSDHSTLPGLLRSKLTKCENLAAERLKKLKALRQKNRRLTQKCSNLENMLAELTGKSFIRADADLWRIKTRSSSGCICCLGSKKLKNMWQERGTGDLQDYGTMLIECFGLPWSRPKDPKNSTDRICSSCILRLRDAVSFKTEVLGSQQLLNTQLKTDAADNLNQEHDDEDTQFDVQTEYLDYEFLEDNIDNYEEYVNDAHDDDDGVHDDDDVAHDDADSQDDRDDVRDDCNKFNEETDNMNNKDDTSLDCNQDYTEYKGEPKTMKRKHLKSSTDLLKTEEVDAVIGAKRFKGANVSNDIKTADETCKTQTGDKMVYKKTKGYLEEILRYSNATPFGAYTPSGFQCSFCRDHYENPKNLKHHTLDKHAENVIVHTSEDHVKLDITKLKCLDCYANVDSIHDFVNHMQIEHRMFMRKAMHYPIVPFKFDSDVMKCALCQKVFKSFDLLNDHMSVHFESYGKVNEAREGGLDEDGGSVEKCKRDRESLEESQEEVRETHRKIKIEEIESVSSKYKCTSCGRCFGNQTALALHKKKYHKKLMVKCKYCHSKFVDKKNWKRHVLVKHKGKKP